jgi:hypothetical protein
MVDSKRPLLDGAGGIVAMIIMDVGKRENWKSLSFVPVFFGVYNGIAGGAN